MNYGIITQERVICWQKKWLQIKKKVEIDFLFKRIGFHPKMVMSVQAESTPEDKKPPKCPF